MAAKRRQRIPDAAVGMKPVQKIAAALITVALTELLRRDAAQMVPKGAVRMTAVLTKLLRRDAAHIVQRDAASIGKGVYQT